MAIVIDSNTWSCVFNEQNAEHDKYKPLKEWIDSNRGKLVYGGTKYKQELSRSPNILKIFNEYNKMGKTQRIIDSVVDAEELRVRSIEQNPDFDDPHIVAIIRASQCRFICSGDARAYRFFKDRRLYNGRCKVPKIYCKHQHLRMLLHPSSSVKLSNCI